MATLLAPWDWPLRTKLAIALLVPSLLAVGLGSLRVADQTAQAREQDRVARFVDVHENVSGLIEQLQLERLRATLFVAGGRRDGRADMEAAAAAVDASRDGVRTAVEGLYRDDTALVAANVAAQQALDRLPGQRLLATTSNAPASAVVSRYSDLVAQLVELDDVVLRGVNPTQVSGLANALAGLDAARNEASLQQALLASAGPGRPLPPGSVTELADAEARLGTALRNFRVALDPAQRVRYAELVAGATNTARSQLVAGVTSPTGNQGGVAQAQPVYDAFVGEVDRAQDGVRGELAATSAERREAAADSALLNVVLLVLALLAGAAVVLLIARQLVKLLRTLRESALQIARTELPETVARMRRGAAPTTEVAPVPVATREDIGQVARAFDAVHSQAVRLAAEQAALQTNVNAMYVNLSRRSQTLVDSQLRLIEGLERAEEDPDQLDNLFRLDHLATRMRRNCENLLVLAGAELPGSTGGTSLLQVVQAAVSETDQYQRITVRSLPDIAFVGRVSKDLWHLLAELLDNATNFSPPDSPVVVSGSSGAGGAIVISVVDRGIGMPADDLAAVNRRLSRTAEATAQTARQMGLFVVGQLAHRHGIQVFLQANEYRPGPGEEEQGGLTVLVVIPSALTRATGRSLTDTGDLPVVPAPRAQERAAPAPVGGRTPPPVGPPRRAVPPGSRPMPTPTPTPVPATPPGPPPPALPRRTPAVATVNAMSPKPREPLPGTASEWFGTVRLPPYASGITVVGPADGAPPTPPGEARAAGGPGAPRRAGPGESD